MCAYVLTPFFIQPRFSPFPLCVQHTSLYCQQTALSFVLCVLVMRLKMLANPLLCVCASLLVSQSFRSQFVQHRHVILRVFVVFAVVSSTCAALYSMTTSLPPLFHKKGEFNDPATVQLVEVIDKRFPVNASLTAPMSTTSALIASVHKRVHIVNHPHYEDARMRRTTFHMYIVYTFATDAEVHNTMTTSGVDYVVINHMWCGSKR
eukprot:m.172878 g.172878  ORF g.172878 m.172878 type:complete len:206 (-) comp13500_c1_seq94:1820-2437(-)